MEHDAWSEAGGSTPGCCWRWARTVAGSASASLTWRGRACVWSVCGAVDRVGEPARWGLLPCLGVPAATRRHWCMELVRAVRARRVALERHTPGGGSKREREERGTTQRSRVPGELVRVFRARRVALVHRTPGGGARGREKRGGEGGPSCPATAGLCEPGDRVSASKGQGQRERAERNRSSKVAFRAPGPIGHDTGWHS